MVIGEAQDEVCTIQMRTLEVATEAWYAMTGSVTPPTEAQLVTDGVLRTEVEQWDLIDGGVVPAPGGRCR